MPDLYRFHVQIGENKKRSTVSLPKYLLVLFSLNKGYNLQDKKVLHKQIRLWCEQTLRDSCYDEYAIHYSQFLQKMMTEELLDKKLSDKYGELFVNEEYEKIGF